MTKKIEIENDILYIDNRELERIIDQFVKLEYNVEVVHITEQLKLSGDYYYCCDEGELLVERKQMPDLDGSILNHHIFDQSHKISSWIQEKEKRYGYVKTIGDNSTYNEYVDINYPARIGALESIQGRTGVPVNNYTREEGFVWSMHKLIRLLKAGEMGKLRTIDLFKYKHPDINLKNNDPREIFINNFRIWGASKPQATLIVDTLVIESVNDCITVSYSDLIDIKGIGEKTVWKILGRMGIMEE